MTHPTGAREALDLDPCKFCGSTTAPEVYPPLMEGRSGTCLQVQAFYVVCHAGKGGCGSCGGIAATAFDAIQKWNRHALQAGPQTGAPDPADIAILDESQNVRPWPPRVVASWKRIKVSAQGAGGTPQAPCWTREKPKVEGWYFLRNPHPDVSPTVVEFIMKDHEAGVMKWYSEYDEEWEPIFDGREWSGPIPEPVEAIKEGSGHPTDHKFVPDADNVSDCGICGWEEPNAEG